MIRELVLRILKSLTRTTSLVSKELTQVIRRPAVLLSLVLGPFLIMALFGVGYDGERRPLDTVLFIPAGADLPREHEFYQEFMGELARLEEVTDDLEGARARLRRGEIDLLVVAPADLEHRFRQGEQTPIGFEYNHIDPLQEAHLHFAAEQQVGQLNQALIRGMVGQAERYYLAETGDPSVRIPQEVVAEPTRTELHNWAPLEPQVLRFFAPAILALILQHMAVTLAAISTVRERLGGTMETLRVSPIHAVELVLGKYLAFALFNLAIAGALTLLLIGPLGIPLLAPLWLFLALLALISFTSLGLGLLVANISDSEHQAVQLSMLLMLASVFLSGFVVPPHEFVVPVRWLAYLLPATHGIQLLQDVMLRGGTFAVWHWWALGGGGLALFVLTSILVRRDLARA